MDVTSVCNESNFRTIGYRRRPVTAATVNKDIQFIDEIDNQKDVKENIRRKYLRDKEKMKPGRKVYALHGAYGDYVRKTQIAT